MKLTKSEKHNPNYLAKLFKIENIQKHPNADKLQVVTVDFQTIITGMIAQKDHIYIYFPLECQINEQFLSYTNSFSSKELNVDNTIKGFFDDKGRVKAVKLRGEKSMGYIVPLGIIEEWVGNIIDYDLNQEFDMIGDIQICKKYFIITRQTNFNKGKQAVTKISRLIDNQFRLHNDTENLRKNIYKISPNDIIGIHKKKHGSSWVVGNILVKRPLNIIDEALKWFGVPIIEQEYDYVYASRNVVKNEFETQNSNHFYEYDIWEDIKEQIKDRIPKGFTLYGEILGYTKNGAPIQKDYYYGCEVGESKIFVYRITITNVKGDVIELDDMQIKEFCDKFGFNYSETFLYYGRAIDLYPEDTVGSDWWEIFLKKLERDFTEKDCSMCKNKVPEEGIVVRKMNTFYYEAYKLKSFRFLEKESKTLDQGVSDIESEN